MDSGTKRRLVLGLISNWISKAASSIIQLVQIPFLLHFWSEPVVGNWFLLIAIPSYLSFSNIGFGSVAGNEMTMAEARNDRETSIRVFQSCWWLIFWALLAASLVVAVALYFIPVGSLLNVHFISERDCRFIVAYLGLATLLNQFEQLLQSAYRSVGRYPYGSFIKSCMSLAAFGAMLVPVGMGYGPRTAALVYASANIAGTVLLALMVRHDIRWLPFGWRYASFAEIKRMTPLAFAFLGFPIGNALNIQGTLQAVGYAFGPVAGPIAVVVFTTARTVSRIALQMVQMVNSTFEPEFSRSFAQNDIPLVRTLHRHACQMALIIALGIVALVALGGPTFLHHWTQGKVPPSRSLLMLLLAGVVLYSLWSTSSTVMYATNQHKKLAAVYLGATGVTVLLTFALARIYGLYGAAASLLISEFIMNFYVLPASLRIAHDTFAGFARSMFHIPAPLQPRAIFRRLRRSRPQLES